MAYKRIHNADYEFLKYEAEENEWKKFRRRNKKYVHISQTEIDAAKKEFFANGGTIIKLNYKKKGE
jgi:hypothetical protein